MRIETLGLAVLVAAGCGKSAQYDPYSAALTQTRSAVEAYRAAGAAAPDPSSCEAQKVQYRDAVQPPLGQMQMMSGQMMSSDMMQGGMMQGCTMCQDGGFSAACAQMQAELDAHLGAPCSPDAGTNAGEVVRHCDQMMGLIGAEQQHLDSMSGMMGGGMMGGGGMMQ